MDGGDDGGAVRSAGSSYSEPSLVPADLVLSTLLVDSFKGTIPIGNRTASLTYLWCRLM
jgi:hypothetical protein